MKIAIFMHVLGGGGAEKIMVGFANYLAESSEDTVTLILASDSGPYVKLLNDKVNVVVLDKSRPWECIIPLYNYLKTYKVDVIYSTLINNDIVALIVGLLLSTKVIIRIANTISEFDKTKKSYSKTIGLFLTKFLYRLAYKCISISEIVKADILEFTFCQKDKIKVIYNPIMIIDNYDDAIIDKSQFNICFVGRLTTQKNIQTIAKLIEKAIKSELNVVFHFFGEGDEKYVIEDMISRNKFESSVVFHGFELSYYSYIKHFNLFIHIPIWEGLGNSVLEVFNSGIPMILSDVKSGFSELIRKEYSNIHYVHPTSDVDKILYLIKQYLSGKVVVSESRLKLNISKENTYNKYRELIFDESN
jgi:glycosyltransferase involved in cell wall biosynthesis